MEVRDATPGDAQAIAAIYAHHVLHGTATFDTEPRSGEETAARIAAITAAGLPFLVAEVAGGVAGYAYATRFRDRAAYAATCEDSIYIDPAHTGRGIGSALLAELVRRCEAAGYRQMIAVVGGGEPASIALHRRLGFTHAGTMRSVGRKFRRWLDTVYMQRALGDGDQTAPASERPQD
ncbi:MAG: GNAT family N-acetyltransferase [Sphingopyxis sp.]|nr:GNAT family N-acetyltransferase [Sphingopyxis sp.]